MRTPLVLFTTVLVIFAPPPSAHSQSTAQDSSQTRRDSETRKAAGSLDTIQIVERATPRRTGYAARMTSSATKTLTPLADVPQSVTVVTHELIADQNMQSMADVTRYVPGITMAQGEGNRDQPTMRGNTTSSNFFIDGVRDDIQFFRDLYNIERVDVLTGSSAMIFGRGSGGGILNRVTKQPGWAPERKITIQGGSYDNKRVSVDLGQGLTEALAARLNAMYENSGYYRNDFRIKRYGINPTATYISSGERRFAVTGGYEHFNDHRTADRGVPSFNGQPFNANASTFFGDPKRSHANATIDAGDMTMSYTAGSGLNVRNHTRLAAYDKIYQNVYPGGAVTSDGLQVAIVGYNNAARRHNLFNQTDLTYMMYTGPISHTLLAGAELGRQVTDNFKNTAYFNNTATSVTAFVNDPAIDVPVTFRQSATDANNHNVLIANSVYAQDQIGLTSQLQLIAGVRAQAFNLKYHNNRGDTTISRHDHLFSPKAGLVYKPVEQLSLYTSYGISYLPSSGDQFSSLTRITQALEPEKFTNAEAGAKWQAFDNLLLTAAVYRLDRTNTKAPDPVNPTLMVQTGKARSTGTELSAFGTVNPAWQIAATYTNQRASITSRTSSAAPGATVAIVPHTVASLWNKVQVVPRVGVGVGLSRQSDMYAAVDNKVTLRGYSRVDGALFVTLNPGVRAQLNVDNVLDRKYFLTADNNNNITPGAPRTVRVSLTAGI